MNRATPVPLRRTALPELPLVGRSREMAKLVNLARARSTALIYGPHGIGKTRLLLELDGRLSGEAVDHIYIRFREPLHAFLLDVAGQLAIKPANTSSVTLRGAIWKKLESKPHVFLLDDIAEATPPYYRFFEPILAAGENKIIGAATDPASVGALRRVFWDRQAMIGLRVLGTRDAGALAESALETFLPDASILSNLDSSDLCDRIARAARGNPGLILEMCIRVADPAYRTEDRRVQFGALVTDSIIRLA